MALKDWRIDKRFSSTEPVWKNIKTRNFIQVEKTLNIKEDRDMWRLLEQQDGYGSVNTISWHKTRKTALKRAKAFRRKN